MRINISILFLFAFFGLFAQTKTIGRVLDSQTREPIASAMVTMHPIGFPTILAYTITAEDGTFALKRDNLPDSVSVTRPGHPSCITGWNRACFRALFMCRLLLTA